MKKLLIISALLLAGGAAIAQNPEKLGVDPDHVPTGLDVGEEAPLFQAVDQHGKEVKLASLRENGPVVLIFYRGHWCPVCNKYLKSFTDSLQQLEAAGAQIIAVTPSTPENVAKMSRKFEGALRILGDQEGAIMEKYGVDFKVTEAYQGKIRKGLGADIASSNGQEEARLPVPATYIIDKEGVIAWRQFDLNYHNRASVAEILAHLPSD